MTEKNYPYPIIFAARDPQQPFPNINIKTEAGIQKFFSRTNYNLFIDNPEQAKHLSIGTLFKYLGTNETNHCEKCKQHFGGCRLFVKAVEPEHIFGDGSGKEHHIKEWIRIQEGPVFPAWQECNVFRMLLGMTETEAERTFLGEYLIWAGFQSKGLNRYDQLIPKTFQNWQPSPDDPPQYGRYITYIGRWDLLGESYPPNRDAWEFSMQMLDCLSYPALIPQVWLNFIYERNLGLLDPARGHLEENPARVDFVMLFDGGKHVIEIDGPEHYAEFKGGRYLVSEERYTKNLRIERRLEWDGWKAHRFSNWEVLNTSNMEYFVAVLGLGDPLSVRAIPDWTKFFNLGNT